MVPEFFCPEHDWTIYHKLIDEMREIQAKIPQNQTNKGDKSQWISWHEGKKAQLIKFIYTKGPGANILAISLH